MAVDFQYPQFGNMDDILNQLNIISNESIDITDTVKRRFF